MANKRTDEQNKYIGWSC